MGRIIILKITKKRNLTRILYANRNKKSTMTRLLQCVNINHNITMALKSWNSKHTFTRRNYVQTEKAGMENNLKYAMRALRCSRRLKIDILENMIITHFCETNTFVNCRIRCTEIDRLLRLEKQKKNHLLSCFTV